MHDSSSKTRKARNKNGCDFLVQRWNVMLPFHAALHIYSTTSQSFSEFVDLNLNVCDDLQDEVFPHLL